MLKACVAVGLLMSVAPTYADNAEPPLDANPVSADSGPVAEPTAPIVDTELRAQEARDSDVHPPGKVAATADEPIPPLRGGRLLGEALLGTVFAGIGGAGGAVAGVGFERLRGSPLFGCPYLGDGGGCIGGVITGGVIGLTLFAPVGVYLVGSNDDETGSVAATLGGAALGSTIAGLPALLTQSLGDLVLMPIGATIGSMIGFNLTRRRRPSQSHVVPIASVTSGNSTFGVMGSF